MTETTTRVLLTIPRKPPVSINAVLSMNRWKRQQHAALWKTEAVAAWMNANYPPFVGSVNVTIRCYYRGDQIIRDFDGLAGSCKPILDGLKGRAFPDDSMAVIGKPTYEALVDNRNPRVEIEIEEATDDHA